MHRIEALLRKEIGLDAASIGTSAIERTVRLRMKRLGLQKADDYVQLLNSSRPDLHDLVEAVVVTETWFFRDREPFKVFTQLALERLSTLRSKAAPEGSQIPSKPGPGESPLRVLSVPCSSGEEPYSLAMALLDQQIVPQRFVIDAVDISAHALARAKQGVYGKNSFRGKELHFRDRYFWKESKDSYALSPRVRETVRFHRDNLLGAEFLVGCGPYDFIFCRNLLIYFDRATQERALGKLHQLLAAQGVLFVGPAEVPLAGENGFVATNHAMAFACRKAIPTSDVAIRTQPPGLKTQDTPPWQVDPRLKTQSRKGAVRAAPGAPSALDAARQLADAGQLEEATAICENHLRAEGPSAQAYYLLGLVRDATGDPQALEYYRKALYLEPNHYESLVQMSLLLEKTGDVAGARIFKRRAQRLQPGANIER